MLKNLLLTLVALLPLTLFAQIEVHDNGRVSVGGLPTQYPASLYQSSVLSFAGQAIPEYRTFEVHHRCLTDWSKAVDVTLDNPNAIAFNLTSPYATVPCSWYVHGGGWMCVQGVFYTSDSTIKKDLKVLPSALEHLDKITGYSYHYKPYTILKGKDSGKTTKADTTTHWGVLAQDVERVAPFAVKEMENGKKGVDYTQLIPLNIEAIKELNAKVKTQENEIALMNARFNKLAESIDTAGGVYKLKGSQPSSKYILYQNNPNPSNADTKIKYDMKASYTSAFIYIFNLEGLLKKTYKLSGSTGSVTINSGDLDAGMYLYSLVVDGKEIDLKRMLLTK